MTRIIGTTLAAFALLTSGCASNLCARKDSAMQGKCAGVLMYTPDPLCQHNLDNCDDRQLAQFRGYVECLENLQSCSLDTLNSCSSKYPGGVNLMCSKRDF